MRANVSALWKKQFVGAATNAAEYAMSWDELLGGGGWGGDGAIENIWQICLKWQIIVVAFCKSIFALKAGEMYLLDANWIRNKKYLSNYSQNDWVLHNSGVSRFD